LRSPPCLEAKRTGRNQAIRRFLGVHDHEMRLSIFKVAPRQSPHNIRLLMTLRQITFTRHAGAPLASSFIEVMQEWFSHTQPSPLQ
jgi:hypothetical protein